MYSLRTAVGVCALALLLSGPAQADAFFSGDTTGAATFLRPDSFTTTATPGAYPFVVVPFFVDLTGEYRFELTSEGTPDPNPDTYALVYEDTFTSTDPLTDLIAGDDDFSGTFLLLGSTVSGFDSSLIALGEATNYGGATTGLSLTAGVQYFAVITGFSTTSDGTFTAAIGDGAGLGTVTLGTIPEPSSMALLGIGAAGWLVNRRRARAVAA